MSRDKSMKRSDRLIKVFHLVIPELQVLVANKDLYLHETNRNYTPH